MLERWFAGHEEAARKERELLRQEVPRPEWSLSLALSIIAAAERAGTTGRQADPVREREIAEVRMTWQRLRERWL
jgi:thymidylate kinase